MSKSLFSIYIFFTYYVLKEVQSLNSGSISSTRLFVKRSVSFDIRSRPFGYKRVESSDPVEDAEQPKRRVKRLKSLVESPVRLHTAFLFYYDF